VPQKAAATSEVVTVCDCSPAGAREPQRVLREDGQICLLERSIGGKTVSEQKGEMTLKQLVRE
jgi:hypothetical protein